MEYQSEEMQSKYAVALSKYNTHLHDDEVQAKVDNLITKHLDENNNIEVKKQLFSCIDLTSLKCTDSEESIMKLTEKVNEFVDKYPDLSNVAAICVYPNMAEIVSDTLEADDVKIACVAGGFPSSQTFTEVKVAETAMAIHTGAEEIDIVIPVGKFLCGDYEGMCDEIGELARIMARTYGDQSFKEGEKHDLSDEMADVLWVLICLANQTGVDLTEAFQRNLEKKTNRDKDRHKNNPKLKRNMEYHSEEMQSNYAVALS